MKTLHTKRPSRCNDLFFLSILIFIPVITIGQTGNLDQIRNGQAGNPSGKLITGVAIDQSYEYVIEYDTKQGDPVAIDYLTHNQRLESSGFPCDISGPSPVCPGSTNTYCAPIPPPANFTYSWSVEGDGAISGAANGKCVSVVAAGECGSYTVKLHIESVRGIIKIDCQKAVAVQDNTAPTISCPPDIVVECGLNTDPANTGTATATDNCSAEVFFVDEFVSKNCFNPYIIRTWIARDPCNNSSTCEQRIILVDRTAPAVICPPDLQINCGDPMPTPVSPVFFETCSPTLSTVFFRDDPAEASGCPANPNNINRTWTVIDASGNIGTCVQKITFVSATLTSTSAAITATGKAVTVTTQPADKTGNIPLKGNLSALQVRAEPNPYSSIINFRFVSPQSGHAMLVVYNLTGAKMAVVYNGQVTAGVRYTINYKVPVSQRVPLIYKLSVGANSAQGKLLSFGRNFNQ